MPKKFNETVAMLFPHDNNKGSMQSSLMGEETLQRVCDAIATIRPGDRIIVKPIPEDRRKKMRGYPDNAPIAAIEVEPAGSVDPYDPEKAEIDAEAAQGSFDF
jgi:hypothetical protein